MQRKPVKGDVALIFDKDLNTAVAYYLERRIGSSYWNEWVCFCFDERVFDDCSSQGDEISIPHRDIHRIIYIDDIIEKYEITK